MVLYESLFFLIGILSSSCAFKVTNNETKTLKDGKVRLTCIADAYYDWCRFKHKDKACEFQWSRDIWDVKTYYCKDFEKRFEFVGNYDNYECAIEIDVVTDEGMKIIAIFLLLLKG